MARRAKKGPKRVETLTHDEATRKNIPTAELQSAAQRMEEIDPVEEHQAATQEHVRRLDRLVLHGEAQIPEAPPRI